MHASAHTYMHACTHTHARTPREASVASGEVGGEASVATGGIDHLAMSQVSTYVSEHVAWR